MKSIGMTAICIGVFVAITSLAMPAMADITVGTSSPFSGNCYPFMCNDSGTSVGPSIEYQQVYTASAFGSSPLTFGALTFYENTVFGGTNNILGGSYAFSWGYTSDPVGGLSGNLASNFNVSPAKSIGTTVIPAGGVNGNPSFTFSVTPFTYNPAKGNLLLDIFVTNQDLRGNGSGNSYNQVDSTAMESRAYAFGGSGIGPADGNALVTTFVSGTATPEPSFLVLLGVGVLALIGIKTVRGRRQSAVS